MISLLLFWFTLIGEIIIGFALLISHFSPSRRIWPPPEKKTWQFYFIWVLTYSSIITLIILGFVDWNSFILDILIWRIIGGILFTIGLFILIWGMQTLSLHLSHGLKGELITNGPYKFSRNPQYISINLAILGYIILTNSFLSLITGVFGIILFFMTPFVEEPWLKEVFGTKYEEYCKKVRRFI
ncbi:MAG: isoprenylcysteine carboxylmethyltransferase family protein [Candidatus Lokiarchaeota archaeon]|nr:isoprenylcysteine carboxylmethyltransferase family protein [Candidatus Lokiarchaeota archaeon]